jgi:hypothetical protein
MADVDEMDRKTIVYEWIKNPSMDPEYKTKVKPHSKEYAELYDYAYEYLLEEEKKDKLTIKSMLPKVHLMFDGKIDLLYYLQNREDYVDKALLVYDFVYQKMDYSMFKYYDSDYKGLTKILKVPEYTAIEKCVFYALFDSLAEKILLYSDELHELLTKKDDIYTSIPDVIGSIKELKIISSKLGMNEHLHNAFKLDQIEKAMDAKYMALYDRQNSFKFKNTRPIFANASNIFDTLIKCMKEVYYMIKYKNYPKNHPFENAGILKQVEDPLVTILKKLDGKNKLHKYLDLTAEQLATPSGTSSSASSKSSKSSLSESPSPSKSSSSKTSPSKSSYSNSSSSTFSNSSSSKFSNSSSHASSNSSISYKSSLASSASSLSSSSSSSLKLSDVDKKTLKAYKQLIDTGLLDLTAKAKMKTTQTTNEFLTKNREYFKQNVLYDADNLSPEKCNYNLDAITNDDFSDKFYPLAKLQLMFKLHTKDQSGKIVRTDCFYAPPFYNYIVTEVIRQKNNNQKPVIFNPLTKDPISVEEIQSLTDIIRITKPSAVNPLLVPYDKYLQLDVSKSSDSQYYHINVVRPFGGCNILICKVCVIPNTTQSNECIKLLTELFEAKQLLFNYMPPYFINNKKYIRYNEIKQYNHAHHELAEFIEILKTLS